LFFALLQKHAVHKAITSVNCL